MSYEAWGDDGDDGRVTVERAEEAFVDGLQTMREMLARFVEQGGDHDTAASIRANWAPAWGKDPGKLDGELPADPWGTPMSKASVPDSTLAARHLGCGGRIEEYQGAEETSGGERCVLCGIIGHSLGRM